MLRPTAARAASGSISPVPSSTSHSTGVAPTWAIASAEAMNVWPGTITSSPGPIPWAFSISISAEVPDDTPTQCDTSQ